MNSGFLTNYEVFNMNRRYVLKNKPKAIIQIGGNYHHVPMIFWAQEMGLQVVVTDINPDAPGSKFADKFYAVSATDIDAMINVAREVQEDYELVATFPNNEFSLPAAAVINETFALKGYTTETIKKVMNKSLFKKILKNFGVPSPEMMQFKPTDGIDAIEAKALKYPLIGKPSVSSGSKGVVLINNDFELESFIGTIRGSIDDIILEQYCEGPKLTAFGLYDSGKFLPCGICESFHTTPDFYIYRTHFPAQLDQKTESTIYDILLRTTLSIEIDFGLVGADIVLTENGPVVLEFKPFFDMAATLIPYAGNSNPVKAFFSLITKEGSPEDFINRTNEITTGFQAIYSKKSGTVKAIKGYDLLGDIIGIYDAVFRVKPGDRVRIPQDNSDVCGFIWAKANDLVNLEEILERASSLIDIQISPN